MASERKSKKDKEIVSELEYQLKDIRTQLNEQLKCLDVKLESHMAMLWELQDFYKRRAEVEMEYSKSLDRLVKNIMLRHKAEKQRQEMWPGYSTYTCWQTLLASTKRQSKDHSILSELYTNQMCSRFNEVSDDIQRIYKKCREIGFDSHEELLKVLNELQSAMKTYHIYHGESKQAESKLRSVESQKQKVEQHASKGTLSRKFKSFEKQVEKATKTYEKQTEKRQAKYTENKMKALRARNDYLLSVDGANAAINKYYVEDLPDLIDCMDCGYHNTLARAMLMHVSAEENLMRSRQACVDRMNKCVADLDQRQDKQRFLELNNQAFSLPKKFDFQAHKGDEIYQISAQKPVQEELLERHINLTQRLKELKLENDEVWKTLETAETSLMNMINQKDYDVSNLFMEEFRPPKSPIEHAKKRADRMETEAFYIQKFRDYMIGNNLIGRLHAKFTSIQKALGESNVSLTTTGHRPPSLPPKSKKRRIGGRTPLIGQPKLFGGSVEEYVEATNQEIPLIIRSCIKVINLYGKQHQGVFRVSGSQHEINDFKNSFERGEDPLADMNDGKDINSVAGVLKLYFRELREPLFPTQLFDELIAASKLPVKDFKRASTSSKDSDDSNKLESVPECISRVKELLCTLPRPIIIVMRYLFAFLNHLSEYSDENMMDPYNLAICFGPTLLPIPPDRDQVAYQGSVNELIKNVIVHQEEIFPNDGGMVYERFIVEDGEQEDTTDNMSEDGDTGDAASEEETEVMEAAAQYDFTGRTDRELSFKKGDTLVVFNRVSTDWWEGAHQGKEGLIPDKYIVLKNREEDQRSASSEEDKRRSTESLPAKPFGPTSLSAEDSLDKSASHPNISLSAGNTPVTGTPLPGHPTRASYPSTSTSGSSDMSSPRNLSSGSSSESSPSLPSKDGPGEATSPVSGDALSPDDDPERSTEDLQLDIDSALAEVMSGLQSLEMQQKMDKKKISGGGVIPPKLTLISGHPKHTPDLVLDLPVTNEPPSPKEGLESDSPTHLSTAEVFANANQCTIKKGSSSSMPRTMTSSLMTSSVTSMSSSMTETIPSSMSSSMTSFHSQGNGGPVKRSYSDNANVVRRPKPLPQRVEREAERVRNRRHIIETSETIKDPGITKLEPKVPKEKPAKPVPAERHVIHDRFTPSPTPVERFTPSPTPTQTPTPAPKPPLLRPLSRGGTPDRPETKPKPPIKAKPPVMKKPARSPEVLKRLQREQEGSASPPP